MAQQANDFMKNKKSLKKRVKNSKLPTREEFENLINLFNNNPLTKEMNVMTGLCIFDYSPELAKRVIKAFPKFRIYKVKYRGEKNKHFDGIFLSSLSLKSKKVTKEENSTLSEMFDGSSIEYMISEFSLKFGKRINKFFSKKENEYLKSSPIRMICMPIGTEILNIGVENENFM